MFIDFPKPCHVPLWPCSNIAYCINLIIIPQRVSDWSSSLTRPLFACERSQKIKHSEQVKIASRNFESDFKPKIACKLRMKWKWTTTKTIKRVSNLSARAHSSYFHSYSTNSKTYCFLKRDYKMVINQFLSMS